MNKTKIKNSFNNAANNYNSYNNLQKDSAGTLLNYLKQNEILVSKKRILDIGCGCMDYGKSFYQNNIIFNYDISQQMLKNSFKGSNIYKIQGDMDYLSFKNYSFDIIISNFAMQWSQNINNLIKILANLLKKDQILIFAIPNSGSINELKKASTDTDCQFYFKDMPHDKEIMSIIKECNFAKIRNKISSHIEYYDNPYSALKKIKKIGANYSNNLTPYITKSKFLNFINYKNNQKNNFKLTWNISYFLCIK